jgi:O-antigen/teichoic acid export membrane protein
MSRSRSLGGSTLWRLSETAGNEAISFAVFVILARLLTPEDFGSVALAGAVMVLMQAVLYHGSTDSLVQLPQYDALHARAAMAANLRLATAMIGVAGAVAWPMAWLLHRPEFAYILWAMLPSLWLRSLCGPMLAALRRQMDFRSIALRTLLGVGLGGVLAIALARAGAAEWALVAQQWTGEIVGFAVLCMASPVKPWSARWNRPALDELLPVALPVMGAQLSNNAARRLDTLAVEWSLGHHAVGIYFMVYRLVFAVQMLTQHGLGDVSLVVLSRHAHDRSAQNAAILRVLKLALLPCGLAFGCLALLAPVLVPVLFGQAWGQAVQPLSLLAALAPAGALVALVGVGLVAAGQAHTFQRLSIGLAVLQLLAIVASSAFGLSAVALAIGVTQWIGLPVALHVLGRGLGLRWPTMARALMPLAACYAFLLGAAWMLALQVGRGASGGAGVDAGGSSWASVAAAVGFAVTWAVVGATSLRQDWLALSSGTAPEAERSSPLPDRGTGSAAVDAPTPGVAG